MPACPCAGWPPVDSYSQRALERREPSRGQAAAILSEIAYRPACVYIISVRFERAAEHDRVGLSAAAYGMAKNIENKRRCLVYLNILTSLTSQYHPATGDGVISE